MRKIESSLKVLSDSEVLLVHESAMKILSNIGMRIPNDELLHMCAEAGCQVDMSAQNVKFPSSVMVPFLDGMKSESVHHVGDQAQELSGWISTQVSLVDYGTKTRRYGMRDDNMKNIALVEHLKNIPVCNAAVVPSDVPYDIADVITTIDILKYSHKPGGTYILTPIGAKYISQVNQVMGRRDGYLFETISPLTFKKDTVDMALAFAKNGGGLGIAPMAMSSATAPVTVSGTLTLETAEVLGSAFLVHLMTGEYPGFSASCHSVDPQTMLCSFGSPNQALFAVAAAQMGRFYGINSGTNSGLTDALVPDFQGGLEKGITAVFNALSGSNSIGCQGIVGADMGFSYEQLVIDNEWLDYYNYITQGFEVSEETIGYDVIEEVGIAGNFLGEEHTVEYMRDSYWMSNIFNRQDWSNWVANGQKDIYDRAHEFVERVTADYRSMSPVISQSLCEQLDEIAKAAYREVELKSQS